MPRQHSKRQRKSSSSFEKKVLKIVNKQAEKKVIDQSESDTSIVSGQPLNMAQTMAAQGDGDNQRDGDRMRLLSIRWRCELALLPAASEGAVIRFIGLRLPGTNVDGSAPIADFTGVEPNNFYTRDLPYKYKVLFDKNVSIGGGSTSKKLIQLSHKCNDEIVFDGTAATDNVNFKYYLLGTTSHGTATELAAEVNSRMVFTDS